MICRHVLKLGIGSFDYFNDATDTICWLERQPGKEAKDYGKSSWSGYVENTVAPRKTKENNGRALGYAQ